MNWTNLLSGLIGAIIGGLASIIGGLWATNKNIAAQNALLLKQEQNEDRKNHLLVKASAKTIHSDVMSAITEAQLIASSKKMPSGISVGTQYSQHITNLISFFDSNEIALIYKIYGHIERLKIDYQKFNEQNAFDPTRRDAKSFVKEIFGDNEPLVMQFEKSHDQPHKYISLMKSEYKMLLEKLASMY